MKLYSARPLLFLATIVGLVACSNTEPEPDRAPLPEPPLAADVAASCGDSARALAEQFGERLKLVSTTAPDSIVARGIQENYAPLVTPALLTRWISDPGSAPGREVSSPWPERIEVRSVAETPGGCKVDGDVVYVTSVDTTRGGETSREPVSLVVSDAGGWRISEYGL